MSESLLDPDRPCHDGDGDERPWAQRSRESLADELRRRKRRLEARNPLRDPDGYVEAFRVIVALQAHLRDRAQK